MSWMAASNGEAETLTSPENGKSNTAANSSERATSAEVRDRDQARVGQRIEIPKEKPSGLAPGLRK
jgi:hypothetical protein